MVKKKIFIMVSLVVLVVVAVSCSKPNEPQNDLMLEITGTYQGSFTSGNGLKNNGTALVSSVNDSVLQIHCYDDDGFDTTFVMEFYPNGDSVMLCNTGQDFFEQYGHEMSGSHHKWEDMTEHMGTTMMSNDDWQQHLQRQHQAGDEHFGAFNTKTQTFYYRFEPKGKKNIVNVFLGTKVSR